MPLRQDTPFGVTRIEPGREFVAVTPHDTNDLAEYPTRGLILGAAGDISILGIEGDECVLPNMAAGIIHPIAARRVRSTGTDGAVTAAGIVAVY